MAASTVDINATEAYGTGSPFVDFTIPLINIDCEYKVFPILVKNRQRNNLNKFIESQFFF
jgi:hypothetical protein